ncbi:type VII secretion target [Nocardia sp. NPDC049220]|uniref:type VII secretion target n=1 Tax=Nocardia sp. NPDC049220 TaxID=3155273 RepID=UPI0034092CE4
MSDVVVIPTVFRQFGAVNATQAAAVAMSGAVDQAAAIAAAAPVFGPIGADFLASFAQAQANHLYAVGRLAEVHAASSVAAELAAASYEATESASADEFTKLRA